MKSSRFALVPLLVACGRPPAADGGPVNVESGEKPAEPAGAAPSSGAVASVRGDATRGEQRAAGSDSLVLAPARPYNVILVMIDSLRADMPWAGYPREIAPWLTAFEKKCASYTRAYSLSSYTAKSVAPALVGAYPSEMKRDGYFFTKYGDENVFVSERAVGAGHRTLAGHAHGYFMPQLGNNQGFDDYRMIKGGVDLKAVTSVTGGRLTALALEMLGDEKNVPKEENERFFAYFHYLDPHHTYVKHAGHPDYGNKARDLYDNEVHFTDAEVGKLLDWVALQAWAKETAIIVTADHGEGFGEHNQFRHAYEVWEALVRVPWFFYVPGATPRHIDAARSHIDLAPTIADLMGLPLDPPFRGKSLVGEVFGTIEPEARRVVVDLPRSDLMDRRRAVIADGYKIIAFGDDKSFQLYHLAKDPEETKDIAKADPEALLRMKKIYEEESAKIPNEPVVGGAPLKGAPAGQRW